MNKACSSPAVRPGVQGPPDGRLADAVHHRRARRLHGRHGRQLLGQVALQRSGHDDRQVGLQQEVVDRRGQHLVHRLDDVLGCAPASSVRIGVAIAPRPDHADRVRLRQQIADRFRLQPHRPAGPSPDHRPRRRGRVDPCARRQVGQRRRAAAAGPAARRWRTANPTAPHRVYRRVRGCRSGWAGPADPAMSTPADATSAAVGDSMNRSAATVGAQYGPAAVLRLGFRHARRDQPGRRGHLEDQPEPTVRRCR